MEHENCPEVKDLVRYEKFYTHERILRTFFSLSGLCFLLFRAEVIIGGFVVKELSSDPPSCLVTYITRVDLKGKFSLSLMIHTSYVYNTSRVCYPLAPFFVVYMPEHFRVFWTILVFQLSNFFLKVPS